MPPQYGRWPWSWPVEIPVKIDTGDEVITFTKRFGTVPGAYQGMYQLEWGDEHEVPPPRFTTYVGRGELRSKLRNGEYHVVDD